MGSAFIQCVSVLGFTPSDKSEGIVAAVVGAAYEVGNVLGAGFMEKVYERALARELGLRGLGVKAQVRFPVRYKGISVGDSFADMVVEGRVIVELKCAEDFSREHLAQCINYLKASGMGVAVMLNFKKSKVAWKRVVLG
jgi:GxxExxY protein